MKKPLLIFTAAALSAVLVFSGFKVWEYFFAERQAAEQFCDLAVQVQTPALDDEDEKPPSEWTVYDQYGALFEQNADMIGWIRIDNTSVNYPVMQSLGRPDFYLSHSFDRRYSDYGVPYVAEGCTIKPQSDNITIFGHHMSKDKMFGALEGYKNKDFYNEHKTIHFDTRAGFGTYRVIAVFRTTPARFSYHHFINAKDQGAFYEYERRIQALSFYDTGASARYGDKLITLSTCEYSEQDSRLVIVAKKIGGDLGG